MQDNGIELYRRFLNGDERGLEELIALYQHGLLRFIYGYVRDFALAEDILQETFISLYFHRAFKPRDDASFKTYLYKIARNKSLNALKKRKRKKEISLDALTAPMKETPDFLTYSPHGELEEKERAKILQAALEKLKPDYREALTLRYYDGLSPEQIAAVTKKNIKKIYNLLARGKAALKAELQKEGRDHEDL
ncbi:MAG: RNA polymerase sigma factor [Clostridia bacterium]|nr:RNA polymerase sigma factor [Clostridia bacterium]